jgi:hypothetical protein
MLCTVYVKKKLVVVVVVVVVEVAVAAMAGLVVYNHHLQFSSGASSIWASLSYMKHFAKRTNN